MNKQQQGIFVVCTADAIDIFFFQIHEQAQQVLANDGSKTFLRAVISLKHASGLLRAIFEAPVPAVPESCTSLLANQCARIQTINAVSAYIVKLLASLSVRQAVLYTRGRRRSSELDDDASQSHTWRPPNSALETRKDSKIPHILNLQQQQCLQHAVRKTSLANVLV